MKIIQLTAENVKRLRAVDIRPDGAVVRIGGRNAQGKSSVLDSIEMALGGASHACSKPVRNGTEKARIVCKLEGGLVVKRTFTAAGGGTLIVENAEGARYTSPQAVLDKLVGKLTFDPLEFTRMAAKQQLETIKSLVGLDFTQADTLRSKLFSDRTDINREVSRLVAQIDLMPRPDNAPDKEISVAALAEEFSRRQKVNAENERLRSSPPQLRSSIADMRKTMDRAIQERDSSSSDLAIAIQMSDADIERQIANIREQGRQRKADLTQNHERRAKVLAKEIQEVDQSILAASNQLKAMEERIEAAVDLDVVEIQKQMADAEVANRHAREHRQRSEAISHLEKVRNKSKFLSDSIDRIDSEKRAALASAKFPLDGLSFGEDGVLYNNIAFGQASSAEQLRVSTAICFAMNPTLRILLIRDGSLLDADGLKLIAEIAAENDAQVWLERVEDDSTVGIIIEDGRVVGNAPSAGLPGTAAGFER